MHVDVCGQSHWSMSNLPIAPSPEESNCPLLAVGIFSNQGGAFGDPFLAILEFRLA